MKTLIVILVGLLVQLTKPTVPFTLLKKITTERRLQGIETPPEATKYIENMFITKDITPVIQSEKIIQNEEKPNEEQTKNEKSKKKKPTIGIVVPFFFYFQGIKVGMALEISLNREDPAPSRVSQVPFT